MESKADTSPRIDFEFKENLLYQEGIVSKIYQGQINHIFKKWKN